MNPTPVQSIAACALLVAALGACLPIALALAEPAARIVSLPNPMCPVLTDEPADPDIWVEWEGRRVYLCCNRCKKMFLADPAKYAGNLPPLSPGASEPDPSSLPTSARLVRFAGKFHPALVHFPLGLLVTAALLEAFAWVTGRARAADAARLLVPIGAVLAVITAALGLAAEAFSNYPGELHDVLDRHETLGIATATSAVIVALIARRAARRGGGWQLAYRLLLLFVAALIGVTAHVGGALIYGLDHYSF